MTAEEAIKVFKSELDWAEQNRYPYISENKVKATKLAVKALEQQQQPNRCDSCTHSEEQDGSNCYECVKGMADNFEAQPTEIRDATAEERKSVKDYVESISKPTGVRFEAQPCEDAVSRSELQKTMDSLPLFRFVNNDHEEADDYYNCESVDMVIRNLPSVTPRTNLAETSQDCISREEMLKYQQYLHGKMSNEENHKLWNFIKGLPSVTPKYTDEEIDKAQAVEQAYVDKMVELAVEESRKKWLNSFDTSSATKCFEAVNVLKERLENNGKTCEY